MGDAHLDHLDTEPKKHVKILYGLVQKHNQYQPSEQGRRPNEQDGAGGQGRWSLIH